MPESGIFRREFEPSETTASVPESAPVAAGANFTLKVRLWLGSRVVGRVKPAIEKADPVMLAWEIVTAEPPTFFSVSDRLALLLTCTLPKLKLAGVAVRVPGVFPTFGARPTTPWHPARASAATANTSKLTDFPGENDTFNIPTSQQQRSPAEGIPAGMRSGDLSIKSGVDVL